MCYQSFFFLSHSSHITRYLYRTRSCFSRPFKIWLHCLSDLSLCKLSSLDLPLFLFDYLSDHPFICLSIPPCSCLSLCMPFSCLNGNNRKQNQTKQNIWMFSFSDHDTKDISFKETLIACSSFLLSVYLCFRTPPPLFSRKHTNTLSLSALFAPGSYCTDLYLLCISS